MCCVTGFGTVDFPAPTTLSGSSCDSLPCQFPQLSSDVFQCLCAPCAAHFRPVLIENSLCSTLNQAIRTEPFLAAVAAGDLELVKKMVKIVNRGECEFTCKMLNLACICAASKGHLDVLKFLTEKVMPDYTSCKSFEEALQGGALCAAAHGHTNILKFLLSHLHFVSAELVNGCCVAAACNGHLKTLKFLLKTGLPESGQFLNQPLLNSCTIVASANGHVNIIQFIFNKALPEIAFTIERSLFNNSLICASANGRLDVLQFLLKFSSSENHWYLKGNVLSLCCLFASKRGHAEVLDFFSMQ